MHDFAFITQMKDEPVALAVLGGLVLLKVIEALAKNVPFLFKKRKKSVEETLEDEAADRKTWQEFVGKRIDCIESKIESLVSIIADHEEFLGPLSQGTLENMLFNDNTPIFRRLKSYLRLIAMGRNGRVKQKGFDLILQNKKTVKDSNGTEIKIDPWLDVLETMPKMNLKIVNQQHFDTVLEEINHKIYDGMMR